VGASGAHPSADEVDHALDLLGAPPGVGDAQDAAARLAADHDPRRIDERHLADRVHRGLDGSQT
jgi:hypothetical protein